MAEVAGISGEHYKEAGNTKIGLKAERIAKEKKEEKISAFPFRDVH